MSATNPASAPVATTLAAPSSGVPESGGAWNEITNCGANVLHLAYRVAGIVFVALQKVIEWILSLASSSFEKVHTWITGVPSTAALENERAEVEAAIRAADIEERLLGTAPPAATSSETVSASGAAAVQQLPAVRQLTGLAAATAGLSEEEQYALMQLQQQGSEAETAPPELDHLTGGLSEEEQFAVLQQQTGGESYVRPPQTQLHEAPLIEAAPRRPIPDALAALIPQNQDGVAFLKQRCPDLLNDSVVNVDAVLRPAARAAVLFCLDSTSPFPECLPAFLQQPTIAITQAPTFNEALERLHRAMAAGSHKASDQVFALRVKQLVDRLIDKHAFQACVYGACDSE